MAETERRNVLANNLKIERENSTRTHSEKTRGLRCAAKFIVGVIPGKIFAIFRGRLFGRSRHLQVPVKYVYIKSPFRCPYENVLNIKNL